ncbi:hypothetical protein [Nonomuraea typhae]|uniref:Uncharacterized protein n=1 Tax=Nonomuraea typhae TaxID=2603600 RepID=A0ABW7ZAQ5_9ACTN
MLGSTLKAALVAAAITAATPPAAPLPAAPLPAASGLESDGGETFAQCMRSHGLPGFPEVSVSEEGLVNLTVKGERVDVMSKVYGEAVKACRHLLPGNVHLPTPPPAPEPPFQGSRVSGPGEPGFEPRRPGF